MNYCRKCKYFERDKKTPDCEMGTCKFGECYTLVNVNCECPYIPERKRYTCKDCKYFKKTFACMDMPEDSPAEDCPGFTGEAEEKIEEAIRKLIMDKRFDRNIVINIIDQTVKEFKTPFM